ncbi:MAG: acyltransferase [Erysipelotrichaceae bacterium]|jgi:acetyltransferase-like isoleucine patch superfamily enzyme|nr:acyltransferase [Erysipelotrichaceae bacterium]
MDSKRLFRTIRLFLTPSSAKRTNYLKRKGIFKSIGDNCSIMDRYVPLYSNLISVGNNVHLASNVKFITHDISHVMLNNLYGEDKFKEQIGCIEIGNNVFIGANCTILLNVKIGNNVIVGANSVITKDIPDNSVCAGIPARVIGDFDSFVEKRSNSVYPNEMKPIIGKRIEKDLEEYMWNKFHKEHGRE